MQVDVEKFSPPHVFSTSGRARTVLTASSHPTKQQYNEVGYWSGCTKKSQPIRR